MNDYLLMSIKTKHANKIFNGTKTFEYRTKSIGEKNLNKYCYIYSSEDAKAVIGYVIFDNIVSGSEDYIIKHSSPENITALRNYFKGKNICYALHIKSYKLFDTPLSLEYLKKINNNFNVPQFYRYIKPDEALYSMATRESNLK